MNIKETDMLKIWAFISLVVLALILMAAYQFVTASAQVNSNPSSDPANVIRSQGGSTDQLNAPVPANPSTVQPCTNTPFGALASVYACLNPGQIPAVVISNPGASTRWFKPVASPNPDPHVRCVDAPFGAVASAFACPNPSQIPAPVATVP
jgi:hypothetical protein